MLTPAERPALIDTIRTFPSRLAQVVDTLSDAQLDRRTDIDSWTVQQLVHHLADSHMNAFIRMKLILTEQHPTLKPYNQDAWVVLADETATPISASLAILEGLHTRWATLLASLSEVDWSRSGLHPENGEVTLDSMLAVYAEHGDDHIAQIQRILKAKG